MTVSVILALGLTAALLMASGFILFFHQERHETFDQWVDFSFSGDTVRRAFGYYRFMGVSMIVFYVLFTISLLLLQAEGHVLFADEAKKPIASPGPISTSFFTIDLMLRGALFDFMQHFDLRATHLYMNRQMPWFVWYAFVFRMFYGLSLVRILFSFALVWNKSRVMRQRHRQLEADAEPKRLEHKP
jgi:hypothetical protein